jgi:hypothetical protein
MNAIIVIHIGRLGRTSYWAAVRRGIPINWNSTLNSY